MSENEDTHANRLAKLEEIRILLNDSLWELTSENVSLYNIIDNLRAELSRMDERMKVLQNVEPLEESDLDGWASRYLVKKREDNR